MHEYLSKHFRERKMTLTNAELIAFLTIFYERVDAIVCSSKTQKVGIDDWFQLLDILMLYAIKPLPSRNATVYLFCISYWDAYYLYLFN